MSEELAGEPHAVSEEPVNVVEASGETAAIHGEEGVSAGNVSGEGEERHVEAVDGNREVGEEIATSLEQEHVPVGTAEHVTDAEATFEHPTLLPAPVDLDALRSVEEPRSIEELHRPDSPTISLIASLRSQLTLLSDQAQALNQKLVESISVHADLEDQHYHLQTSHKELQAKTESLEKDKKSWEESINSGLLVERSQIRDEMQRLAAGLVEEERRRGSAEERREAVEGEINDLTAKLFMEAQAMVAVEHMARAKAEDRLKTTVENLAAAEAAMRDMQLHLQSLPTSAIPVSPPSSSRMPSAFERKYLSSHVPFAEFIIFLQHLRALRPLRETSKSAFPPPQIINLMAQPFLARIITEDHDPTIRLDAAPDVSWLSRKGVSNAIISGDLVIEPLPADSVIANASGNMHDISCSLCGKPVFPPLVPASPAGSHFGPPPVHPTAHRTGSGGRFSLRPFFNTATSAHSTSPSASPLSSPGPHQNHSGASVHSTVYIFRVAKPTTATTAQTEKEQIRLYPLCKSGWCLDRLRATCELWYFVRTGIIHSVWHGDDGHTLSSDYSRTVGHSLPTKRASADSGTSESLVMPTLPKRKSGWGLGLGSTGGWTKAFGSKSGTSSPPISPGAVEKRLLPPAFVEHEERADDTPLGEEAPSLNETKDPGLGAPVEITEQPQEVVSLEEPKEVEPVPTIQEPEPSPASAPSETVPTNAASESQSSPDALSAPSLARADSSESGHSLHSESHTDEASFSTPKGTTPELPNAETQVDLNSPVIAPPPPVPRRATARGSPPGDGGLSPVANDESDGTNTPVPEAENENGDHKNEKETTLLQPPPLPPRAPPALPPRHPRTPTSQVQMQDNQVSMGDADGLKAFLGSEGWEARTWRQVVKLKEGMWKARIGVVDTDE
ncbi:hypothetical protein BCR39DRAFT_529653 [Naematelia encephala]|uniref:GDP/GTP exchange factor Sec2 N-terminal domain-containing protein n=1 Tax=Naematelia encephala TaxID=71784 RepID=A0A1Y2B6C8_9TREE|nr:hypothetical protein BCR39DRAFT_529653 [Naematelia encephala]